MTDTAIRAEAVGKRYQLGRGTGSRYLSLRENLVESVKAPLRRLRAGKHSAPSETPEEFWALRDVSFEIQRGEVVGIIGRNGAGKSTLLKLLSRITEPTTGRIALKGRVASLLEVGTGFHPELTGRENIFLNGAILGMSRVDIKAKFDEIVAFAEVERFLDTPVKRYSSGMYVRLAFAVAAHLEPEILIVDEVLSVGDAEFQKKCLGKMQEFATGRSRTVIFVSHDLQAVRRLCTHGIYLSKGQVAFQGTATEAIGRYVDSARATTDYSQRSGEGSVRVTSVELSKASGVRSDRFDLHESIHIDFHCEAREDVADVMLAACFDTLDHVRILSLYSSYQGQSFSAKKGRFVARCIVPRLRLMPGEYYLLTHLESRGVLLDALANVCNVYVQLPPESGFRTSPDQRQGFSVEEFGWQIINEPADSLAVEQPEFLAR